MIAMPREETMDIFLIKKTVNNENGMVMIFSLMVLMILTISGVAAINISNNETSIVRNEQLSSTEFYQTESGINDARLNFVNWLTNTFLTVSETTASAEFDSLSTGPNGPVATIRVRCIEPTMTPVFDANPNTPVIDAGSVADQMPAMPHIGNAPLGSGNSVKFLEIRRYSITSTSTAGNTIIQAGVWKVFNKY